MSDVRGQSIFNVCVVESNSERQDKNVIRTKWNCWSYLWNSGWYSYIMWKSFSEQTSRSRWWTAHLKLRDRLPLICKYKRNIQNKLVNYLALFSFL